MDRWHLFSVSVIIIREFSSFLSMPMFYAAWNLTHGMACRRVPSKYKKVKMHHIASSKDIFCCNQQSHKIKWPYLHAPWLCCISRHPDVSLHVYSVKLTCDRIDFTGSYSPYTSLLARSHYSVPATISPPHMFDSLMVWIPHLVPV